MHIWRFGVAANSLSGDLKHMSHLQKTLMPFCSRMPIGSFMRSKRRTTPVVMRHD